MYRSPINADLRYVLSQQGAERGMKRKVEVVTLKPASLASRKHSPHGCDGVAAVGVARHVLVDALQADLQPRAPVRTASAYAAHQALAKGSHLAHAQRHASGYMYLPGFSPCWVNPNVQRWQRELCQGPLPLRLVNAVTGPIKTPFYHTA